MPHATARELFGKAVALRAVLLAAVLPIFFFTGFFMTPDVPLVAAWAGGVYYAQRALLGGRARAWYGFGLCVGLGMSSKYTIALLGLAALAFCVFDPASRRWFLRREPWIRDGARGAGLRPGALVERREWMGVVRVPGDATAGGGVDFRHPAPAGLPRAAAHAGRAAGAHRGAAARSLRRRRPRPRQRLDRGRASPGRGGTGSDKRRFAVVFTLVPLSVFLLFSLTHEPKLNWAGPLWLAALPLLAWDMAPARVSEVVPKLKAFGRRTWPATLVLTTLTYGVLLHTTTLGLPFFPPLDKLRLAGNRQLGSEVQAMVAEADTGGKLLRDDPPLVVGLDRYRTASLMAFYRPDPDAARDTTSVQMVGGEGLMYGSWIDADRQAGRTMVLVAEEPEELGRGRVADRFASLGPVRVMQAATPNGGTRRLYGRVGRGYVPERAVLASVSTDAAPDG